MKIALFVSGCICLNYSRTLVNKNNISDNARFHHITLAKKSLKR